MLKLWVGIFAGIGLAVGATATAAAAAGTTGAEFLSIQVPAGSAAQAAGTAASGGSETLTWNPAGLCGQDYPSVSFTHLASFADTAYEQLEGLAPGWLDGTWAVRLFYASTYQFTEVDGSGNEVGNLENYDLLGEVAYARALAANLEAGVGLKLFESALAGFTSQGFAVDAGIRYHLFKTPVTLAAAVQNLGAMTAFDQEADPLPRMAAGGVELTFHPWEGQTLQVLADLNCPLAGDEAITPAVGLEYKVQDIAVVRGGYRFSNELGTLSLGAGLRLATLGVDYAFQPYGSLGNNHRITFSYYFKPASSQPAPVLEPEEPRDQESTAEEISPQDLSAFSDQNIQPLTVLPREFEGKMIFKVAAPASEPKPLVLEIRDTQNQVVKTLPLPETLPAEIEWNGQDEHGRKVSGKQPYVFDLKTSAGTTRPSALPQFTSVVKLRFEDGTVLEPEVGFEFLVRPEVQNWSLTLHDRQGGQALRTLAEPAALPLVLVWDGRTQDHAVADTRAQYAYQFMAVYAGHVEVTSLDAIQPVLAKPITSPSGQAGLLIPGILFGFNSAVLKPEMTDKLVAAAEILKRHPGQARAVCEGHADEIGSRAYNQKISEQRAYMVAKFLSEQLGAGRDSLTIRGFGQDRPESLEKTDEGRALNRRVEIRIWLPSSENNP